MLFIRNKAKLTAKALILFIFGIFFSMSVATAAELSQLQIDSILSLLRSFGADQATLSDVEAALTGQPVTTTTTGDAVTTTTSGESYYKYHPDIDYMFTKTLKQGSRGEDVRMLQKVLGIWGLNGVFGPMT